MRTASRTRSTPGARGRSSSTAPTSDGDQVTFTTRGQPAHGSASASNGQLTYTGDAGYAGPDSVPFTATDGHGATVEGSWPVEVAPPEVPDCIDGPIEVTVRPGRTVSLPLFCFNPQGDPQTFSAPTPPTQGHARRLRACSAR